MALRTSLIAHFVPLCSLPKMENPYEPHEFLVAPARPTSDLWRLLVGLTGWLFLFIVGSQFYFSMFQRIFLADPQALYPVTTVLILFHFGVWIAALGAILNAFHRRPLSTLLGPIGSFKPTVLRVAAAVLMLNLAIFVLPPYGAEPLRNPNITFGQWMLFLPLGIFGIFLQTSAEELLFRGYLQSQLAARFRSPIVWMLIPSALFAIPHYSPAYGDAAGIVVIWAFAFGVMASDLTARTGSLGPAIALHFANNIIAVLWIGSPESLGGLAFYHSPYAIADWANSPALFMSEFLILFCSWLVVRIAVRR